MHQPSEDLLAEFLSALDALGLRAEADPQHSIDVGNRTWQPDWAGTIGGVAFIVEAKSRLSAATVAQLEDVRASGFNVVVVSPRINDPLRALLRERKIDYFDARGHLRLWRAPLLVDTDVSISRPLDPPAVARPIQIESASSLDVALAVLDGSIATLGVRGSAAKLERAPGTVSKVLSLLRDSHLVDEMNHPTVPDLFELALREWHPRRMPLADLPRPGRGSTNDKLKIGFEDPDEPGWVLADFHAAAAWGAPVVLTTDSPPDFYVPDVRTAYQARALYGRAEFGSHACTVAVAPAPFVCRNRFDRARVYDSVFMAPSPVVVALDLASDPGRGQETLDGWNRLIDQHPGEVQRVW